MSSSHFNTLPNHEKNTLRSFFLGNRKFLLQNHSEEKRGRDLEIQSRLLMTEEYRNAVTVLCYVSRDYEVDTIGFILASLSNRKRVAVPRCEEDGVMRFYLITSLSDLEEGSFGIKEPKDGTKELTDFCDSICICPALCCDMRGYRVGFGKGYYDRFLQGFDGETAALCYSDALITEINADEHDIPTALIVTDEFVRRNNHRH